MLTEALPFVSWSVRDSEAPAEAELGPSVTHEYVRRLSLSPEMQEIETRACQRSPWYWLVNWVVTEDSRWASKGLTTAYQRFPPKEYLRSACQVLWKYPHTAWPKSRQMLLTWLVSGYMLGEACFLGGRLYMVQSKKETDAKAVLARQSGMYHRLADMAPWMVPKLKRENETQIILANGSTLMACPEGAHHVQSYTPAWLFLDEVQLQDEAQEAYHQALPACERITLVGSADVCWFYDRFLTDELKEEVSRG